MYVIKAHFQDIHEISFGACLDEIGVYVLWSLNAIQRPSYIGEGDVVSRVAKHMTDDDKPFATNNSIAGCVAIIGREKQRVSRKRDAEIVERTLLDAADRLGVPPSHNKVGGKIASIDRRGEVHDTIRVSVSGMHPLREGVRLPSTVQLTWRRSRDGLLELDNLPWRRR